MLIGMRLMVPWGFSLFTLALIAIEMLVSEGTWKWMKHYPEDQLNWSDESRFVIQDEE